MAKKITVIVLFTGFILFIFLFLAQFSIVRAEQLEIEQVSEMPHNPEPYEIRNWKKVAQKYDEFIYDFDKQGEFLPLIKWRESKVNFDLKAPTLPSYVGGEGGGEAINVIASVLGASLAGIDKSDQQGENWVLKQKEYFNDANEENVVLNHPRTKSGNSFWYEILPNILFFGLVDLYPETAKEKTPLMEDNKEMSMEQVMYKSAENFHQAAYEMGKKPEKPDFNWTSFDFKKKEPVYNGKWREPDSAAGIAWLQLAAYNKFGEDKFLRAAGWSLDFLEQIDFNPMYEILLPYGAYTAARMNAEHGEDYNLEKIINWCFESSETRSGWGIINGNWGGFDVYGLQGSTTDSGGYAFAMNTFQMAGALLPIVRYDSRYAEAIGKWMLNLTNNARLFYGNYHADKNQSTAFWDEDPDNVIAYEGLRKRGPKNVSFASKVSPYATGDAQRGEWAPTDLGLYGSSQVGILGGIVEKTEHEKILKLDLLKTDYFQEQAYPSYLFYNPYDQEKIVEIKVNQGEKNGNSGQSGNKDIYDTVSQKFLTKDIEQKAEIELAPQSAAVIVITPAGDELENTGDKKLVNDVVIDYLSD